MTVKQLKQELDKYPDHMEVYLAERRTDFPSGLLNTVISKEIPFSEEPDGKELSRETVVILDED